MTADTSGRGGDPSPPSGFAAGSPAPAPPPLRSEAEIVAAWESEAPVATVLCSTYQHVEFVEDALHGILGQQTTFPFEVVVRDDASTDGTAEIVADIADRYPNLVRAILEPTNRWRQPGPRLRDQARGRYVARCEGDDYWIDPGKLQSQVDTLERHPDAVASHHQAIVIEDGRVTEPARLPADHCRDYRADELMRGPLIVTATLVFRNLELDDHPQRMQILNRDMFLVAQLGEHGGAKWEPDILPAVHRHHPGGVWSARDPVQRGIDSARSYYWIGHYFLERDREVADHFFARGLAWYLRGIEDTGADPAGVLGREARALARLVRGPVARLPAPLRRLVDERVDALERLSRIKAEHERLRARRSVRTALWLADKARPLVEVARRVGAFSRRVSRRGRR